MKQKSLALREAAKQMERSDILKAKSPGKSTNAEKPIGTATVNVSNILLLRGWISNCFSCVLPRSEQTNPVS